MFLIRRMNPNINFVWIPLNLLDNESIRTAEDAIKKLEIERIHVVINNAGVVGVRDYTTSKQGVEGQFAANYLGHFLLTNLSMDQIIAAKEEDAVIVNVGSLGYELGEGGKTYNAWRAFGQSKTAMILWNIALGKRLANKGVLTLVVHPGTLIKSNLQRHASSPQREMRASSFTSIYSRNSYQKTGNPFHPQRMVTRQEAAGAVIRAALDPAFKALSPAFIVGEKVNSETRSYAISEQDAETLWKLSEQLVGERFDI
ncbi:hypothetical protein EAF00_002545 [Botryotinia globosa]|nr:hypothetical protein EAF00_002545 [Botryotinia globosa]